MTADAAASCKVHYRSLTARVYTGGYKSPDEKYSTRHPGGLPQMMDDISRAATMEFRPKIGEIGFPPPSPSDPREKKPKADDPDYSQKLLAHEAFNFERDVCNEVPVPPMTNKSIAIRKT